MNKSLLKLTPREFCGRFNACYDGTKFALKHETMAEVWKHCPRVDWLCWILSAIEAPADEKAVRIYMVWCARNTPLHDGRTTGALLTEKASLTALEVAERYAAGKATLEELDAACYAAQSAVASAAWSAVASAARSAAWSAVASAAWSAATSAARSAAWSAVASAAASAAADAQVSEFRKLVHNPFEL